ncbi:MAG: CRISPR-associated endonuclease Cas3'', partial [Bacteroidales bacterium]|nr:CRISPR-associated endonuclease Cas3'' [Bacteroidales bacterium]
MIMFDKDFFDNLLKGKSGYYYAHLPKSGQSGRSPELLSEHSALTVSYAKIIVEAHNLDGIIKKLAEDSVPKKLNNISLIADTIEELFWKAIAFHDLGKINHEFQQKRMENNNPVIKVKHSFGSQHSIISAYLYLALFFYDFQALQLSDEEQTFLVNAAFYLCNPIIQHHSPTIGKCQNENEWSEQQDGEYICGKEIEKLRPYLQIIDCQLNDEQIEAFHESVLGNTNFIFDTYNQKLSEDDCGFPLFALIKLLYSLLTAADYLATAHYMNGWQNMISDFGILGESTKNKIVNYARNSKPYNKQTYSDIAKGKT